MTTKAIRSRNLSRTYWFLEKEPGFLGSLKALVRSRKVLVPAVRGIDLDIEAGEAVGFIGPNGAGKTTTLKMLAGILHPSGGELEVLGFTPCRREKEFLRSITLVTGQRNRLFWDLSADDYLSFCRAVYEIPPERYRRNLEEIVEMAEIGDILRVPQRKLSAGQRKLCELAAAFIHDPRAIFLDEPTNALDVVNARRIRDFIRRKREEGRCAIILTSHSMADIERICERVIVIDGGRIILDGSLEDLRRRHGAGKEMRAVFGGPWDPARLRELGEVRSTGEREVVIEVQPARCAAAASRLLAEFPVQDIEIRDLPLERVVESIYLGPGRKSPPVG